MDGIQVYSDYFYTRSLEAGIRPESLDLWIKAIGPGDIKAIGIEDIPGSC